MAKTSRISGFHKLSVEERLNIVREFAQLSEDESELPTNRIPSSSKWGEVILVRVQMRW